MCVNAKSLDALVLLKLSLGGELQPYARLAEDLCMSGSEVHAAVKRCIKAGLVNPLTRKPLRKPMEEYILHGLRYAFPAERGPISQGMPTSVAAKPLSEIFFSGSDIPVWPDPKGEARGYSLTPLYESAPQAARRDPKLYELLALVDAIRDGHARERAAAGEELKKRFEHDVAA